MQLKMAVTQTQTQSRPPTPSFGETTKYFSLTSLLLSILLLIPVSSLITHTIVREFLLSPLKLISTELAASLQCHSNFRLMAYQLLWISTNHCQYRIETHDATFAFLMDEIDKKPPLYSIHVLLRPHRSNELPKFILSKYWLWI